MEFYMVRHYTYDGHANHDYYDVIPFQKSADCVQYLVDLNLWGDLKDYEWETGPDGYQVLVKREGQYAYDYYYLEKMEFGKEVD